MTDKALLAEFKQANDAVIAALDDYKKWLKDDLLKRSNGDFAIGEDTFRKKLAADEMIALSLDELLAIAEKDLRKNQAAFAETARLIDPKRTPMQVLEKVQADYPPAAKLLSTTQGELDALGRFMTDHHIDHDPESARRPWSRKRRRSCARRRARRWRFPARSKPSRPRRTTT